MSQALQCFFFSYTADASDKSKTKTDDKKQTDKGKKPAEKSTGKSTTTKTPAKSSSKPTPKQQKTGQLYQLLCQCWFVCVKYPVKL